VITCRSLRISTWTTLPTVRLRRPFPVTPSDEVKGTSEPFPSVVFSYFIPFLFSSLIYPVSCLANKLDKKTRDGRAGLSELLKRAAIKKVSKFLDKEELGITLQLGGITKILREEAKSDG
jgi:hypothetical protein